MLLTNNHVLKEPEDARYAEAQAHYEVDIDGDQAEATRFALEPDRLFFTSPDLDFTVVAVSAQDKSGSERLGALGSVWLIGATGKAAEGEWLNIVQHPNGERKQISIRENRPAEACRRRPVVLDGYAAGVVRSAVFNNNWLMVALHHMGVPEEKNGKWQTVDGRDYDRTRDDESRIKWVANEGIRVSRIVQTLQNGPVAQNPLIRPILSVDIGDILARLPVLFPDTEDVAGLLAHSVVSQISPKKPVVAPGGPAAPQSPIAQKIRHDQSTDQRRWRSTTAAASPSSAAGAAQGVRREIVRVRSGRGRGGGEEEAGDQGPRRSKDRLGQRL